MRTEKEKLTRALLPTNRELKTQLDNLELLYARRVASKMPPVEDKEWVTMSAWAVGLKDQVAEWLRKGGPTWINKRQWVMLLISEAAALHREVTKEEK